MLRFFINPGITAYLRGLADEFEESTNSIRIELNRFEEAGMLISENKGNKKIYRANAQYPLIQDLNKILLKYIGVDTIIELVIDRLGKLEKMYLTGDYAKGKDTGIIDLVFVGDIDREYLINMIGKGEKLIDRKLRFLIYDSSEWEKMQARLAESDKFFLLWEKID